MSQIVINLNTDRSETLVYSMADFKTNDFRDTLHKISKMFAGFANGAFSASSLIFKTAGGYAAMLLTFTGAPTAAQTCVVNGVTVTARASGATGNEFNIGGSVTITAAAFVTMFNSRKASVSAWTAWTATSAAGVVTITCDVAGTVGMSGTISTSLTNTSKTDAAGGTEGNSFSV
jgi:hypothetical protein